MNARVAARKQAQSALDAANALYLAEVERQHQETIRLATALNLANPARSEMDVLPDKVKQALAEDGIELDSVEGLKRFMSLLEESSEQDEANLLALLPDGDVLELFMEAWRDLRAHQQRLTVLAVAVKRNADHCSLLERLRSLEACSETERLFNPLEARPSVQLTCAPNAA